MRTVQAWAVCVGKESHPDTCLQPFPAMLPNTGRGHLHHLRTMPRKLPHRRSQSHGLGLPTRLPTRGVLHALVHVVRRRVPPLRLVLLVRRVRLVQVGQMRVGGVVPGLRRSLRQPNVGDAIRIGD
jgi:hypothetical protein